jgi:hypothetical protein
MGDGSRAASSRKKGEKATGKEFFKFMEAGGRGRSQKGDVFETKKRVTTKAGPDSPTKSRKAKAKGESGIVRGTSTVGQTPKGKTFARFSSSQLAYIQGVANKKNPSKHRTIAQNFLKQYYKDYPKKKTTKKK